MLKKVKIILSKKQLRYFYFFIFLSFIAMILETMGIGLIIPFMQTLIDDEVSQYLIKFLNIFNIYPTSKYNLIFILIAILALVYTLKVSFLTYVSNQSKDRLETSLAVSAIAIKNGADIIRVHDIEKSIEVFSIIDRLLKE